MEEIEQEQKESIKLSKNAKGDMQWEIKINEIKLVSNDINRLEMLNKLMKEKFGK